MRLRKFRFRSNFSIQQSNCRRWPDREWTACQKLWITRAEQRSAKAGGMRNLGILAVIAMTLAACGGGGPRNYVDRVKTPQTVFATGPIFSACMRADRKAASRSLCGCVQATANQTLSASDQNLAQTFFADPHRAQEIRQSDRASHESFWKRYKAFSANAERTCG